MSSASEGPIKVARKVYLLEAGERQVQNSWDDDVCFEQSRGRGRFNKLSNEKVSEQSKEAEVLMQVQKIFTPKESFNRVR